MISINKKLQQNPMQATAGAVIDYRDSWRIFKIMSEFVEGYDFLSKLKKEVTILGSARLPKTNKYYKVAVELGRLLGKNGFTTITGGGPGIMEAANKGAYEAKGESIGLNIQLPFEQRNNKYVKKSTAFYYFFTRKVMLTSPANAFVFFPGGFGTLDEFFEVVDKIEWGHMRRVPIVMVGKEYWQPVVDFIKEKSIKEAGSLLGEEIANWKIVETAKEAYDLVKDSKDLPPLCNTEDELKGNIHCMEGLDWKIFRIMSELVEGFEFLTKLEDNITVLGTKSINPGSSYYDSAFEVGKMLAKKKFAVITGGGPGIMEAANKGAKEAGGESVGINIKTDLHTERFNEYLTRSIGFFFPSVRKLMITSPSDAFIFFPGGFGTLHQLFELLTLLETGKVEKMPIILYGKDFWEPMRSIVENLLNKFKTISKKDQNLFKIVNSVEELKKII